MGFAALYPSYGLPSDGLSFPAKAGNQYAAASRPKLRPLGYWVTRRSLSSGGRSADPVAGDDGDQLRHPS